MSTDSVEGRIRALRQRLDMTEAEFASEIRVTQSTVARWEANRAEPSNLAMKSMRELAARYHISISEDLTLLD